MSPSARLLALETNSDFVRELRKDFSDDRLTVVHGSAADLEQYVTEASFGDVELVVSGIPFSTMPPAVRDRVIDAVARILAPDGSFVVYQYANHVLEPLERRFGQVQRELEWRNLVPVRVFRCMQPRPSRV